MKQLSLMKCNKYQGYSLNIEVVFSVPKYLLNMLSRTPPSAAGQTFDSNTLNETRLSNANGYMETEYTVAHLRKKCWVVKRIPMLRRVSR